MNISHLIYICQKNPCRGRVCKRSYYLLGVAILGVKTRTLHSHTRCQSLWIKPWKAHWKRPPLLTHATDRRTMYGDTSHRRECHALYMATWENKHSRVWKWHLKANVHSSWSIVRSSGSWATELYPNPDVLLKISWCFKSISQSFGHEQHICSVGGLLCP